MNKIKDFVNNITKKVWIISIIIVVIIVSVSAWFFFKSKDNVVAEDNNIENINLEDQNNDDSNFTKENVEKGEYKNDISSATTYVQNTQEVQVAVVIDKNVQNQVGNVQKVSCGNITLVTTRVVGPAVLTNSLKALFENKVTTDFVPGNIIPTYHSNLRLDKVMIDDGVAKIYLSGNFSGLNDGWCDASLAIAQITETAKTFPNIRLVEVYQGGEKIY